MVAALTVALHCLVVVVVVVVVLAGRSFLHEFGYDDVVVPVHTASGSVALIHAGELAPGTPVLDADYSTRIGSTVQ